MLIAFNIGNFRSIREVQTLSLVKSLGDEKQDTHTIQTINSDGSAGQTLLKSVAIYGPNASGKSTLLNGLSSMRRIVLNSATFSPDRKIPVMPFVLDPDFQEKPTMFEVIFYKDQIKYQYGFEVTEKKVHSEWLYAYPKGRSQKWFTRELRNDGEKYTYDFGDKLKGQRGVWEASTRPDALLLSVAVQLNSEQLKPIFDWFENSLKMLNRWTNHLFTAKHFDSEMKSDVLRFLKAADFAISDIDIDETEFSVESFPNDLPAEVKNYFYEKVKGDKEYDVYAVHKGSAGDVSLHIRYESDGTQKMFNIAGHWLDALKSGKVLVVDELHENLHPFLVRFLVEAFHDPELNKNNAQLIFTTHETSILSQNVFRRDQIWFAERDQEQTSKIYPLSDFSPKKGQDNLERSYLGGRFGAVPSIKKMVNLFYSGV